MDIYVVHIDGVNLTVEGEWMGENLPATHYDPEEKKTFEISKITALDSFQDLFNLLSKEQIEDIYEQVYENN